MGSSQVLQLTLHSQALGQDEGGHACWKEITGPVQWSALETALLICDMWDNHWSRGASERVTEMAPRLNQVVQAARDRGLSIVHAPSDTLDFYHGSPARARILRAPRVAPPKPSEHVDRPLPIDDTDGGSDTGEKPWHKAWTRQHPAIQIDPERDAISDDGDEIWAWFQQEGIQHLLFTGVHTNMCVLNRSFGIKRMVRWGLDVALVRDLTDAMYNPASSPYVSHQEGTRLVVSYIEKFWCPTLDSQQLVSALHHLG